MEMVQLILMCANCLVSSVNLSFRHCGFKYIMFRLQWLCQIGWCIYVKIKKYVLKRIWNQMDLVLAMLNY